MSRLNVPALLLVLAACRESRPQVQLAEAMPNIPIPPAGELISKEVGEDALNLHFRSPASAEDVTAYYRKVLSSAPWKLQSDTRTPDSTVALYAIQPDHPPLWVRVRRGQGGVGSLVDLTGAKTQ